MLKRFFTYLGITLFCIIAVCAKEVININQNWDFIKSEVLSTQQPETKTSQWDNVVLPHTWNAYDGQDGGNDYYRGVGWYRKTINIPKAYSGNVIYLKIGAANMTTGVFVNGLPAGTHTGGYAAFMFDITDKVRWGRDNVITIKVDNSESIISPPLSADFTFYGGITRDVELLVAEPVHININEFIDNELTVEGSWIAQPGVIIRQSDVSGKSAKVNVLTKLRNASDKQVEANIEVSIKDATGKSVKTMSGKKTIAANSLAESVLETIISKPHLWNGVNDPYLYRVEINVKVDNRLVDQSVQPLGLRNFHVDANDGFFLNGKSYPLRGICLHEEKKDKGRAVSDTDRKEALDLLLETGCNYLRLAHYQHGDFTYHYLDSLGIICWAEIPAVNSVGMNDEQNRTFRKNAVSQMYELLRQQYNHPSVIFWGLSNEINYKTGIDPTPTVRQLNEVVKSEDTYRLTTVAAMYSEKATNWIPDVYANNRYDGWYYNDIADFGTNMDDLHTRYPDAKIGVSEFGVGANINQHEYPAIKPNEGGQYHPEEYQNLFHEEYLKMIDARPYLWGTSIWAGIDFASDGRNEGLQPGINDKGLITFDRSIKKDAFYWLKANWNKKDHFVYISSRRFTERPSLQVPVKVYSNCASVLLKVNGIDQGTKTSGDRIFTWNDIAMAEGENRIEVTGIQGGKEYKDEVIWNCSDLPPAKEAPEIPSGKIQINFEKTSTQTPAGYLKDDGSEFADRGNGYQYGWNVNNTENGRERNTFPEKRYDTFVQMKDNYWSIELPDNTYSVSVAAGDPDYMDSYHKIEVNGIVVVDFMPKNILNRFGAGTATVEVTNGKLDIKPAAGSFNVKINFIHITPISDILLKDL